MDTVIFNTAFVGDLLLSIPFIRELRRTTPGERITLVCRPGLKTFFEKNQLVDNVIELDKNDKVSVAHFFEKMRSLKIRNLFCPHQSIRSAIMLSKVDAVNKVAYKVWWNALFFSHRFLRPMNQPEAVRILALLGEALPNHENVSDKSTVLKWKMTISNQLSMSVPVNANAVEQLQTRIKITKPYIVIAPASHWPTKKWTTQSFAEVASKYLADGRCVYVVGSKAESTDCEAVASGAKKSGAAEIRSLAGLTDLYALHLLMSGAERVFANDSGSMHMAAAAGVPITAIFGPTVLRQGYRPWSNEAVVVQTDLGCRPCGRHGHIRCPIGTHDCMKKISADSVVAAAANIK